MNTASGRVNMLVGASSMNKGNAKAPYGKSKEGTFVIEPGLSNSNSCSPTASLWIWSFKGQAYTWSNNQGGVNNIRERLDRAVASVEWRNLFPLAQVFHELQLGSDHCPLIIHCCLPLKRVPYNFKFETMWNTSAECGEVIQEAWGIDQRGSDMFKLAQKLRKCRDMLKV
ncbi:hypothetical protein RHGRI_030817 [Rhododendron griersonianum]|uniref:Uncharacterized protein n=1 Tax=Rhododendron griersonianum TaxID=479676 RepID=A0AAV6I672_9ERIC|nr:hypothetical protein RHGRI_030817 [Rhododendron griersonianum]